MTAKDNFAEIAAEEQQRELDATDARFPDPLDNVINEDTSNEPLADPRLPGAHIIRDTPYSPARTSSRTNSPAVIDPMRMIAMAVESDASIEKLEKLMTLQERWEGNEARKAFYQAMSEFKCQDLSIGKDHTVRYETDRGITEYQHATLGNICAIVNPALSREGLSFTWRTDQQTGGIISVTCSVAHRLGYSEETTLISQPDTSGGKNGIQAIGSTVSYLQRYTLLAALGLSTENQDDDGIASEGMSPQGPQGAQQAVEYCPEDQFQALLPTWQEKIIVKNMNPEKLLDWIRNKGMCLSPDQIAIIQQVGK